MSCVHRLSKTLMLACIWMFIDGFDSNFCDKKHYCTSYFDTSLIDPDLGSRSRRVRKQKLLRQLSLKVFNRFEWNLVYYCDLLV